MIARVSRIAAFLCLGLAGVAGLGSAPLRAQTEASDWHEAPHSRIRLISASGLNYQGRPARTAAIEIVLDEGWKTYWRSPGEGLVPSFDWSRSDNLAKATILWPAPVRFEEAEGLYSRGYKDHIALPVLLVSQDRGRPVGLRLVAQFGVCKDICIPVEAELRLETPLGDHGTYRDLIRASLDEVPRTQAQGVYCPHTFVAAARRAVNGKPALVIKTAFDENVTGLDLLVEAPEGYFLPPVSAQPPSSRGRLHYVLQFYEYDALDELEDKTLTFTLLSDQGSCETTWRVK